MAQTTHVLRLQDDRYTPYGFDQFYDLPENSVDVITLGASGMREFYNVTEAYAHNGIACATLSTSNQPFIAARYLIEEAEKTQSPQVYVIDCRELDFYLTPEYITAIRRVADSMKFSRTRLDFIDCALEHNAASEEPEEANWIDMVFSYSLYHSRWDELTALDFGQYRDVSWMGFQILTEQENEYSKAPDIMAHYGTMELEPQNQEDLEEVLAYCEALHESQGTEFVFLNSILWGEERHYERANTVKEQVEAAGFTYIDTNKWFDAIGLNPLTDFRDWVHVNVWGSFKYTDYLADYLQSTYDLADHRGEETYQVWQENYEEFMTAYNRLEEERAAAAAAAE